MTLSPADLRALAEDANLSSHPHTKPLADGVLALLDRVASLEAENETLRQRSFALATLEPVAEQSAEDVLSLHEQLRAVSEARDEACDMLDDVDWLTFPDASKADEKVARIKALRDVGGRR